MKGEIKLYLTEVLTVLASRHFFRADHGRRGKSYRVIVPSFFLCILPFLSPAQLNVAKIFSGNMVLQRERPMHIWGSAVPGTRVTVQFAGSTQHARVNRDSSWSVYLEKQKANASPQTLSVACGSEKILLENILVGDVWICSGQSNMEWPMVREMHFKQEAANTQQPLIRLYNPPPVGRYVYGVPYTDSLNRRLNTNDFYQKVPWQQCDSSSVAWMSAVGYYFAKSIVTSEKIPIGLINLSIGGAPIEAFISRDALQKDPRFARKVRGNWLSNDALPDWARERGAQNVGTNKKAYGDSLGPNHAYKPGFAFESGIAPILGMPVKGVIWYQGESNSLQPERVNEYRDLLHLLIDDYRAKWQEPLMPFYWVQLSSIDTAKYKSAYWPQFRNEQRLLLSEVKNGGMAVCSDIGFKNDVHPTNKKDVGERLARWALNKTYKKDIIPSGPLPIQAEYTAGALVISFEYTGRGLKTSDGLALSGFSVDGYTEIEAGVRGDRVVIPVQQKPAFVYYGWQPFTDANLVNSALLPASTFKLEVK